MNLLAKTTLSLTVSVLLASCGGTSNPETPNAPNANTRQAVVLQGECSIDACGAVPSSLGGATRVTCSPEESTQSSDCGWSDSSDLDATVSYRQCEASECPPEPEVECPENTQTSSQACGSENEGPCIWTTVCVPPRITTPCPDVHGCDEIPLMEIGVICSDGTAGGFACVTDGQSCFLERDCD
jgi:hypothetical protein